MNNQILLQEYRVIELICNHQDTIVYLTQHVKLQDYFILKQIIKKTAGFAQALSEAALLQTFQHPYIPKVFATYEEGEYYYLIEEYVEGESLHSICQTEPLSITTILSYSIQLCDLITYLHSFPEPILHLDITPHNIIVNHHHLYLIDFDAAIRSQKGNYHANRYGTIGYAAPEQFSQKRLDQRTDIYSIGKTVEFMLRSQEIDYQLPYAKYIRRNLQEILCRCMKQRKSQRYSKVQQVGSLFTKLYQKSTTSYEEKELSIVVAGAQTHIGTTHVSMLLCSWLQKHNTPCIYVEKNDTKAVSQLWNSSKFNEMLGLYEYEGIPLLPNQFMEVGEVEKRYHVRVTITDCGVLTRNNLDTFLKGDIRLCVYGSKPYEWNQFQRCLSLLTRYDQTYFLNNFQTARELVELNQHIPKSQRIQMPYVELNCLDQQRKLDSIFEPIRKHLLATQRGGFYEKSTL